MIATIISNLAYVLILIFFIVFVVGLLSVTHEIIQRLVDFMCGHCEPYSNNKVGKRKHGKN